MIDVTLARNPHGRMTTTQDVADAIVTPVARPTPTGSAATSSRSTAASSSPAEPRISERPRHRRRLGQRRSRRDGRAAARARRDGDRRPLRPSTTAARAATRRSRPRASGRRLRSSARSATTRSGARRGPRSTARASTSPELATLAGPTGVALILVDARGENIIAVASGANAALTPEPTWLRRSRRSRPAAGDVVLVGHEIPTIDRAPALDAGPRGRRDDDPQPGPGDRLDRSAFGLADVAHRQPRRAGRDRRAEAAAARPGRGRHCPVEAAPGSSTGTPTASASPRSWS